MDSSPLGAGTGVKRGRGWLRLGVFLGILVLVLYFVQLQRRYLVTPWYVPIVGTVAFASVLIAVVQSRSGWRIVSLIFIGLLATLEWLFLLSLSKLPNYTGPVLTGQPMPPFTTQRADGTSFTQDSLKDAQDTVLVFFRGRW